MFTTSRKQCQKGWLPYGYFAVIGNDASNKWGEHAAESREAVLTRLLRKQNGGCHADHVVVGSAHVHLGRLLFADGRLKYR